MTLAAASLEVFLVAFERVEALFVGFSCCREII